MASAVVIAAGGALVEKVGPIVLTKVQDLVVKHVGNNADLMWKQSKAFFSRHFKFERKVGGAWETFYIEEGSGGLVRIKTCHGTYVQAHEDGGVYQSSNLGEWEYFRMCGPTEHGQFAFQTHHGTFLSTDGTSLYQQSGWNGGWECWTLEANP